MAKDEMAKSKKGTLTPQYENMISGYQNALQVVDDIILKKYVSDLSELEVVPLDQNILRDILVKMYHFLKLMRWCMKKKNMQHINLQVYLIHYLQQKVRFLS